REALLRLALPAGPGEIVVRGRGLACGLSFRVPERAEAVAEAAFERGLIVETSGPLGEVVKVMPPLTVTDAELDHGVGVLAAAITATT
ncbi:aminotransferase class III-fold pyridoxal phosphate-dependent enzyme, partial [Pseudonocardia sp. RS010]|uniref:aminotransferase class III-fold pyridoxal phosphate-dependent enzyme n=1 Tax=Pseudonocardia sp. RS010 TaxID=3385979 RepID=UPI0039A36CC4